MQSTALNLDNFLKKLSSSDDHDNGLRYNIPNYCSDITTSPLFYSFSVLKPISILNSTKGQEIAEKHEIPLYGNDAMLFGLRYKQFPMHDKNEYVNQRGEENKLFDANRKLNIWASEDLDEFREKLVNDISPIKHYYDYKYVPSYRIEYDAKQKHENDVKELKKNINKCIMNLSKCLNKWDLEESRKKTDPNQKYEDCMMNFLRQMKQLKQIDSNAFETVLRDRLCMHIGALYKMKNKQFTSIRAALRNM